MLNLKNVAVDIASDLYVAGRHPEEGTEIVGEVFYVTATEADGTRYRHNHQFPQFIFEKFWDAEENVEYGGFTNQWDAAKEGAERLAARIEAAGFINLENWCPMQSVYGSRAYCRNGEEFDQVCRERMAA